MAFLVAMLWLMVHGSQDWAWAAENVQDLGSAEAPTVRFKVYWPPKDPAAVMEAKTRALLDGLVVLRVRNLPATGWVASIRICLSRPADEAGREFWNARLAFPQYDWMSQVRVWDNERRWLWPNLPYLLRLPGKERVERYGGMDPGKGVDNDFAAVLIRKYDASGQNESEETRKAPLVSAEWHGEGATNAGKQTVVHKAQADEFTLHLAVPGAESDGCAGVWLIYADFLGAKPPAAWPKEPEYAGGILAFFEVRWRMSGGGQPQIRIEQMTPRRGTGFDWERWALRTLASPDSKRTAKLADRGPVTIRSPQADKPTKN